MRRVRIQSKGTTFLSLIFIYLQIEIIAQRIQVSFAAHELVFRQNQAHWALNPPVKATSASPLNPAFASAGVRTFA